MLVPLLPAIQLFIFCSSSRPKKFPLNLMAVTCSCTGTTFVASKGTRLSLFVVRSRVDLIVSGLNDMISPLTRFVMVLFA